MSRRSWQTGAVKGREPGHWEGWPRARRRRAVLTCLAARASFRRPVTRRLVTEAIDRLLDDGPALGRPLADRVAGSRLHNLKELRPGSSGASEVRILFIFDPARNAVLLVAGDKSGRWREWYEEAIPAAEAAYEAYLKGHR